MENWKKELNKLRQFTTAGDCHDPQKLIDCGGTDKKAGSCCTNPDQANHLHVYEGTLTEGRHFDGNHKEAGEKFTGTRREFRNLSLVGAVKETLKDEGVALYDAAMKVKADDEAAAAKAAAKPAAKAAAAPTQ